VVVALDGIDQSRALEIAEMLQGQLFIVSYNISFPTHYILIKLELAIWV
jgi:hypothetical protein